MTNDLLIELNKNYEQMLLKLDNLSSKIDIMNKRIENVENFIIQKPILSDKLRSIIKEKLEIKDNKKLLIKLLTSRNIESDVKVFREFYIIKYIEGSTTYYISPIKNHNIACSGNLFQEELR